MTGGRLSDALTTRPLWVVAAGAAVLVAQLLVPDGGPRSIAAVVIYAAITLAVVAGLQLHRPAKPVAWRLIAVAMGFFTLDMVGWVMIELDTAVRLGEFIADTTRLVATLALAAAAAVFIVEHRAGTDRSVAGDTALILAGGGLMLWQWFLLVQGAGRADPLVAMGLPVVLVGLAAVMGVIALRVVGVRRLSSPSMLLLVLGAAVAIGAQGALTITDTGSGPARWTDATWLAAGLLVGAAALHPTMATIPSRAQGWTRVATRLVLLGAVLLANPAVVWLHLLDPDVDHGGVAAVAAAVGVITLIGLLRVGRLVAELGEMRTALAHSERRFRALVQNASDVIAVVDSKGAFAYASPPASWVLGYRPSELLGVQLATLIHQDDLARFGQTFAAAAGVELPAPVHADVRMRRKDGELLNAVLTIVNLLGVAGVEGIVVTIRDVTEQVAFEAELRRIASHDALTGLANRELFGDRVTHALERCARQHTQVGVVFIDLDDFKTVNDSLGHLAGDEVLRWVADRLRASLRTADTAARLGGDEFAVLLEDLSDSAAAIVIVERIRETLLAPMTLEGREMRVGASIGVAVGGADRTAEELLRNADTAMFNAKAAGKNTYEVFVSEMHVAARKRFDLKADLLAALDDRQFQLYYQPVLRLADGTLRGVEALLRWQHPERGLVEPQEFIALMEETGEILEVGRWVVREALGQARRWQQRNGTAAPWVSVNLSVRQFHDPDLVVDLADALAESGVDPSELVIEITESVFIGDTDAAVTQLARLKRLGVQLAIDDFGTGYSALSYLQRFRADIVKVDKMFVDSLSDDLTLAGGIVGLAKALGIVTIAEGVEQPDQVVDLRSIACDLAQGYHFAVPQPAAAIDAYLLPDPERVLGRAGSSRQV